MVNILIKVSKMTAATSKIRSAAKLEFQILNITRQPHRKSTNLRIKIRPNHEFGLPCTPNKKSNNQGKMNSSLIRRTNMFGAKQGLRGFHDRKSSVYLNLSTNKYKEVKRSPRHCCSSYKELGTCSFNNFKSINISVLIEGP